jgi:hypothetical protein
MSTVTKAFAATGLDNGRCVDRCCDRLLKSVVRRVLDLPQFDLPLRAIWHDQVLNLNHRHPERMSAAEDPATR